MWGEPNEVRRRSIAAPVTDRITETDEMFQNAGEKGEKHADPADPPRLRVNKQCGHGTYDNDRPPVVGTVGRRSGQVRLRVVKHTDRKTLEHRVDIFTRSSARVNTDEWMGYNHIIHEHVTVNHGIMNGHVTTMVMAFVRCIPIPLKACGRDCVSFLARSAACTKCIWPVTSRFMNVRSISSELNPVHCCFGSIQLVTI